MKLVSKLLILLTILALALAKADLSDKDKQKIKEGMKNINTVEELRSFLKGFIDNHKTQKGKGIQKNLDKIGSKTTGIFESIWKNSDIQEKIIELQGNMKKSQRKLRKHR